LRGSDNSDRCGPDRCGVEYIRETYDRFANDFEMVLEKLEYSAPQAIAARVAELASPAARYDILDAGCGTGLCAMALKPYARTLVGVDLSPAMLDKARRRGVYDRLVAAELIEHLEENADEFDLVVAGDSVIYFGDLSSLCAAVAKRMRPLARFVFTVEKLDEDFAKENLGGGQQAGYRLDPSGRYRHRREYLRQVLAQSGLGVDSITDLVLRKECDRPVVGMLVTATSPAAKIRGE
jgi:predicted TPR repeat methyltransferase